jgi:putative transposase
MRSGRATLHAYCLMGNHYHLQRWPKEVAPAAVAAVEAERMDAVQLAHAAREVAPHPVHVQPQREPHMLELARYIVRNPVRAGLRGSPLDWPWSSCRATAGVEPVPSFLTVDWLLAQFEPSREAAERAHREFVEEPSDERVLDRVSGGIYLGDRTFLRRRGGGRAADAEIRRVERRPVRESLRSLLADETDAALVRAYHEHGYTLRELAAELGVYYATVSRRLARAEQRATGLRAESECCVARPDPAP